MNSRRVTLLLMAVNLGLVGTLIYLVYLIQFGPSPGSAPLRTKVITNTVTQIAVRKINSTNNLLATIGNRLLNWRSLESTNYAVYIENLRNFGCPEETIRDIIITDVAKVFARRRANLRAQLHPYRFWETADALTGVAGSSPDLDRTLRALAREQRDLIRDLLGVDLRTEVARYSSDGDYADQIDSFLSPEKKEQVQSIVEKYEDLEQEVQWRAGGLFLAEDQEALKDIQRQRRAELKGILSAEEMEAYDLRHSDTANNMRTQLAGFRPTEEEFRRIFRVQQVFDEQFEQGFDSRDDAAVDLQARARQSAQDSLNDELKKSLGPERFAEYARVQDTDYRVLMQMGERFGLAGDVATRVYTMKQAAEYFKTQVESAPNLTDEQRSQAIAGLARETERSVASTLGPDAYKAYQRGGGQWLSNLEVIDENMVPAPPQPTGTTLPYDINLLPIELRYYLLNPPVFNKPPQ
jgi:hypothetical protein